MSHQEFYLAPQWAIRSYEHIERAPGAILDVVVHHNQRPVAFYAFKRRADGTFEPLSFKCDTRVRCTDDETWVHLHSAQLQAHCLTFAAQWLVPGKLTQLSRVCRHDGYPCTHTVDAQGTPWSGDRVYQYGMVHHVEVPKHFERYAHYTK